MSARKKMCTGGKIGRGVGTADSADGRDALNRSISEKEWQQVVLDAAHALSWQCFHAWLSKNSAPGWPDLFCRRGDRALAIEVKTDTGKVTPAQQAWLDGLAHVPGITAIVSRPSNWDETEAALKGDPA